MVMIVIRYSASCGGEFIRKSMCSTGKVYLVKNQVIQGINL